MEENTNPMTPPSSAAEPGVNPDPNPAPQPRIEGDNITRVNVQTQIVPYNPNPHGYVTGESSEPGLGESSEHGTSLKRQKTSSFELGEGSEPGTSSKKRKKEATPPFKWTYAVQCSECWKWRIIPQMERYEWIRSEALENPFMCETAVQWNLILSCNDPHEISPDGSSIWAIDKPGIPRPPPGWHRRIGIRGKGEKDGRRGKFADVTYRAPRDAASLRSENDVRTYLGGNQDFAALLEDFYNHFSFTVPTRLDEGNVNNYAEAPADGNNNAEAPAEFDNNAEAAADLHNNAEDPAELDNNAEAPAEFDHNAEAPADLNNNPDAPADLHNNVEAPADFNNNPADFNNNAEAPADFNNNADAPTGWNNDADLRDISDRFDDIDPSEIADFWK